MILAADDRSAQGALGGMVLVRPNAISDLRDRPAAMSVAATPTAASIWHTASGNGTAPAPKAGAAQTDGPGLPRGPVVKNNTTQNISFACNLTARAPWYPLAFPKRASGLKFKADATADGLNPPKNVASSTLNWSRYGVPMKFVSIF